MDEWGGFSARVCAQCRVVCVSKRVVQAVVAVAVAPHPVDFLSAVRLLRQERLLRAAKRREDEHDTSVTAEVQVDFISAVRLLREKRLQRAAKRLREDDGASSIAAKDIPSYAQRSTCP